MKQASKGISGSWAWFAVAVTVMTGAATVTLQATEWHVTAGAESADRGIQALAFLPNELWIQAGDSIRWTFPTHERHSLTLLTPGQTRPAGFGPTFGVVIGCPGTTPDGSSFDGSTCVTTDVLRVDDTAPAPSVQSYSVTFPSAGNFKFVCLFHPDMTGTVHVVGASGTLPYDQPFYNRQAAIQQARLLAAGFRLEERETFASSDPEQRPSVAVGSGAIVTTGAGSQSVSLSLFLESTIFVHVGDTVEWTNLDPSINHTVTFGTEPADPRPASANVQMTSDGARQAAIASPTDTVNSGYLSPTPQDRANLAQAAPGVTRFRVTFTSPGTFNYICAIHDDIGMKGIVVVQ